MYSSTTADNNTAVGLNALVLNTTGAKNTALGRYAGDSITTGSLNLCIGDDAGVQLTTGSYNVMIANTGARASSATSNYELVLGSTNTTITGKGNSTAFIAPGGTGAAYQGNNSSSWSTTSDRRIKKNIEDNNTGLDAINQIRVRNFEYRTEDEITEVPSHAAIKKEGIQAWCYSTRN